MKSIMSLSVSLLLLGLVAFRVSRIGELVSLNVFSVEVLRNQNLELSKSTLQPELLSEREAALWGASYLEQNQANKAIAFLDRATRSFASRPMWLWQLAEAYYQTGDQGKAWEALVQLPQISAATFVQCQDALLSYQANPARADQWCPLLQKFESLSIDQTCLLAQYYMQAGQTSNAEAVFERASSDQNVSTDCIYDYGLYRASRQQYSEALRLYEWAWNKKNTAIYLRAMGDVYVSTQQIDLAVGKYRQSLAISPTGLDCAESYARLGGVYYYQYKDNKNASEFFRNAIQCDPRIDTSIYWLLARSERALGHIDTAVQSYQVMEGRLKGGIYLLEWRHEYASYLKEIGRDTEARRVYQSILNDAPNDPVAKNALGK